MNFTMYGVINYSNKNTKDTNRLCIFLQEWITNGNNIVKCKRDEQELIVL